MIFIVAIGLIAIGLAMFAYGLFAVDNEGVAFLGGLAVFVGLTCGMAGAGMTETAERERLVSQCLADGRREYECRSMMRGPDTTVVPMPIIVPSR